MKKFIVFAGLFLMFITNLYAGESATPQEVFEMVLKGATVMENLGEEGLQAFNDPKGEFAWKDTYVQVYNCEARQTVGHPNATYLKFTPEQWWNTQDKKGTYLTRLLCEASKDPNGGGVEYWWPKPGETEPSRKITFIIQVPGQPYQVSAGIYDDKISLEELKKMSM